MVPFGSFPPHRSVSVLTRVSSSHMLWVADGGRDTCSVSGRLGGRNSLPDFTIITFLRLLTASSRFLIFLIVSCVGANNFPPFAHYEFSVLYFLYRIFFVLVRITFFRLLTTNSSLLIFSSVSCDGAKKSSNYSLQILFSLFSFYYLVFVRITFGAFTHCELSFSGFPRCILCWCAVDL